MRRPAVLALTALTFAIGAISGVVEIRSHDFIAIYAAARLVALGRAPEILDPASVLAMEHAADASRVVLLPWVHPPAVAVLLAPLGTLPLIPAFLVMTILSTVSLTFAVLRLGGLVAPEQRRRLFPFALLAPPTTIALTQGQTSLFVLALVAGSLGARPFTAGLLLGLCAIRPQTFPLLALAALGDRTRALGLLVGAGTVTLVSTLAVGPTGMVGYAVTLLGAASWSVTGEHGVSAAISPVGPALALGLPLAGLVFAGVALVAGVIIVARQGGDERSIRASAWALLASPHVLLHDAVLAYPALARCVSTTRALMVYVGSGIAAALLHQSGVPIAPLWLLAVALMPRAGRAHARSARAPADG